MATVHVPMHCMYRLTKTDFSVKGLKYMTEMIPKNKKLEVIRLAMHYDRIDSSIMEPL